jgi:very-short-patch-repair endonuclease
LIFQKKTILSEIRPADRYRENFGCVECETSIEDRGYKYSLAHYTHPLCRVCQVWFKDILMYSTATEHAIELYFALKVRGVPAKLEKNDGFKSIDIAVPSAKVNIEVDGRHHSYDGRQALADLKRTLYSFKKGYSTLRIPNSLADYDIEQTANLITEFLAVCRNRKREWYY